MLVSGMLFKKSLPFFCDLQSDDEREMCARTIYCTNIDKKVPYLHSCYTTRCSFCHCFVLIYALVAGHSGRSEIVLWVYMWRGWSFFTWNFLSLVYSLCCLYVCRKWQFNQHSIIGSLQWLLQVFRLRLLGDYHHSLESIYFAIEGVFDNNR